MKPFNCHSSFFLKSENRRLTVSRVVPSFRDASASIFRCGDLAVFPSVAQRVGGTWGDPKRPILRMELHPRPSARPSLGEVLEWKMNINTTF